MPCEPAAGTAAAAAATRVAQLRGLVGLVAVPYALLRVVARRPQAQILRRVEIHHLLHKQSSLLVIYFTL